ncbi:hypothetical protein CR152_06955 [Massilia violaceinigra]|uniref:YcxB-like C-terminal domain-containing protein n=1 Tax=Massilia violaceinigra TaxID=2045208 RepID=A0A2D2DH17_9BURK|nr:YcxB family protein [Massilia violaceinigra]ATQ74271.1 hypothetical protein CR152_06955 [Massilia violaceinigra]
MRIEFDLKFRDYLLFNAIHQLMSIPVQIFYICGAALIFFMPSDGDTLPVRTLSSVIVYFAMWMVQLLFNVIYLFSSRNGTLFTRRTIEIQDDAFFEETRFNKSYHYWPGILKVVKRLGYVAVYVNAHAAHIIPARAFLNVDQRAQFVATVRNKLLLVGNKTA